MDFVDNLSDTTNLPEFTIGGVGRAEIIDNCMIRVTLFRAPDPGANMHVPVVQLIWSIPAWCAARVILQTVAEQLMKMGAGIHMETSPCVADVSLERH